MVFQDINRSFELSVQSEKKPSAHLIDRFFSFLIDYLVISPFVLFALYISFTEGFNFLRLNPQAPENNYFILIVSVTYIIYFSLIQSFFINIWSATPGQYFLKIKMDFVQSNSPIFLKAFIRQSSFWLSFVFLGIPLLQMLTNRKRHTFYDRVAGVSIWQCLVRSAPLWSSVRN